MADNPLALWGLPKNALAVYEAALADPGRTMAELSIDLKTPMVRFDSVVTELVSLGLVQVSAERRVWARPPSAAIVKLATARLRALADDAGGIADLVSSINRFAELEPAGDTLPYGLLHAADLTDRWRRSRVAGNPDSVVEILLMTPDITILDSLPPDLHKELLDLAENGKASLRCLVAAQRPAETSMADSSLISEIHGVQVRTAHALPGWFYVVDSACGGMPRIWGRMPPMDTMAHYHVTEPGLIAALRALFEEVWRRATPVHRPEYSPRDHRTVFWLLAQGLSDDTVARRLGVSVRTVRARVAEAMDELGAQTRFEAAAQAARNGWFA